MDILFNSHYPSEVVKWLLVNNCIKIISKLKLKFIHSFLEFLTKQMDKVLEDIESLKDKARDMHYKNGNGQWLLNV